MNQMPTIETFTLPAHWACAIVNADPSGMEDDDIAEMNAYLERLASQGWQHIGCPDGEPWFAHRNDAGTMACNVLDYTFANYNEVDEQELFLADSVDDLEEKELRLQYQIWLANYHHAPGATLEDFKEVCRENLVQFPRAQKSDTDEA